jgi:hypothetical protein
MSDSNPFALPQRTSLIVYDADIFNCSPQRPLKPALRDRVVGFGASILRTARPKAENANDVPKGCKGDLNPHSAGETAGKANLNFDVTLTFASEAGVSAKEVVFFLTQCGAVSQRKAGWIRSHRLHVFEDSLGPHLQIGRDCRDRRRGVRGLGFCARRSADRFVRMSALPLPMMTALANEGRSRQGDLCTESRYE